MPKYTAIAILEVEMEATITAPDYDQAFKIAENLSISDFEEMPFTDSWKIFDVMEEN